MHEEEGVVRTPTLTRYAIRWRITRAQASQVTIESPLAVIARQQGERMDLRSNHQMDTSMRTLIILETLLEAFVIAIKAEQRRVELGLCERLVGRHVRVRKQVGTRELKVRSYSKLTTDSMGRRIVKLEGAIDTPSAIFDLVVVIRITPGADTRFWVRIPEGSMLEVSGV